MEPNRTFDAAWKRLALDGDEDAVQVFVRASLDPLYRFCFYRVGRNRHLCEEVVQETLLRAIACLAAYQPQRSQGDVLPWLTGLARNEIRRALSREPKTTSLESIWSRMDAELREILGRIDATPLDDEVLAREETCEMVNATMSQLPSHYREALEAKYVARRSVREMAAERNVSEKAVESLLTRARQAFRDTFQALARSCHDDKRSSQHRSAAGYLHG